MSTWVGINCGDCGRELGASNHVWAASTSMLYVTHMPFCPALQPPAPTSGVYIAGPQGKAIEQSKATSGTWASPQPNVSERDA